MAFNKQRDAAMQEGEGGGQRKAEGTAVNPPFIVSRRTRSPREAAVNLRCNLYTSCSQKMQLFMVSADTA